MDLQLNDKTASITGSSKGIGKGIAMPLAREGVSVVFHGHDGAQTERVVNTIAANGSLAYAVLGGLTQDEAVERLVAEAEDRVGNIQYFDQQCRWLRPEKGLAGDLGGRLDIGI